MSALPILNAPIRFAGKYTPDDQAHFPSEAIGRQINQRAYVVLFLPAAIAFLLACLLTLTDLDQSDLVCMFLLVVLALMIPWYHLTKWNKLPAREPILVTGEWCDGFVDADHVMFRHAGRTVRIPWHGITNFILTEHSINLRTPFHWVTIPRHFFDDDDYEELATLIGNQFNLKIAEEVLEFDDLPDPSAEEIERRAQVDISAWKQWDDQRWPITQPQTDRIAMHLCVRKTLLLFARLWWKFQFKLIPAWVCLLLIGVALILLPFGWLNLTSPPMALLLLATVLTILYRNGEFLSGWRNAPESHSDMVVCQEGFYNKSSFQEAWTGGRALNQVKRTWTGVRFNIPSYGLTVDLPKIAFPSHTDFVLVCKYLERYLVRR